MIRSHSPGETRHDRFNQWLMGIGVVILLSSVLSSTYLLVQHNSDLHAINAAVQTVKDKQAQTHTTLTEIKALETQVNTVINGLPAADAQISAFAKQILEVEQFAVTCLTTQNCSNPPVISTTPTG